MRKWNPFKITKLFLRNKSTQKGLRKYKKHKWFKRINKVTFIEKWLIIIKWKRSIKTSWRFFNKKISTLGSEPSERKLEKSVLLEYQRHFIRRFENEIMIN